MNPRRFALIVAALEVWLDYFCASLFGAGTALLTMLAVDALASVAL